MCSTDHVPSEWAKTQAQIMHIFRAIAQIEQAFVELYIVSFEAVWIRISGPLSGAAILLANRGWQKL